MNDTIRQTDTIRQGVFDQQTPNDGTTSRIGSHVSPVGVLQNAQDLVSHEYQLVLHSIKQDLSAVLQRQVNTGVNVDWEQLMQPEAPQEPKHILQGLVYVAKIKDVANTRGGAQVSQHRRVLAQQTYNMLVQELSDVLQEQAVQRRLRDLANASDHRSRHIKSEDPTVEFNIALSTPNRGMAQNTPTLDVSALDEVKREPDDEMLERGSSVAGSYVEDLLPFLEEKQAGVTFQDEISQIQEERARDDANTLQKIQEVQASLTRDNDQRERLKLEKKFRQLHSVLTNRKQEFDNYLTHVETYNDRVQDLRKRINNIGQLRGRIQDQDEPEKLLTDIENVHKEYSDFTNTFKHNLNYLRSVEETDEE